MLRFVVVTVDRLLVISHREESRGRQRYTNRQGLACTSGQVTDTACDVKRSEGLNYPRAFCMQHTTSRQNVGAECREFTRVAGWKVSFRTFQLFSHQIVDFAE